MNSLVESLVSFINDKKVNYVILSFDFWIVALHCLCKHIYCLYAFYN